MMKKYFAALGLMLFANITLSAQAPQDEDYPIVDVVIDASCSDDEAIDESVENYFYPTKAYRYRVTLKDKKNNPYSVKRPEEFLSKKSLGSSQKIRH